MPISGFCRSFLKIRFDDALFAILGRWSILSNFYLSNFYYPSIAFYQLFVYIPQADSLKKEAI